MNEFDGDVEVLDDLNDHWCSKHHKRERNKLIKDLMEFGAKKGSESLYYPEMFIYVVLGE